MLLLWAPSLLSSELPQSAVVLLYHHVSEDTPASTSISPQRFAEQLDFLVSEGYQVWPVLKILEHWQQQKEVPENVVAITFDDAYQSIYEKAWPLLKERAMPFTIFASPGPIDRGEAFQLSWSQLAEMKAAGATIANHSLNHKHLLKRLQDESSEEWLERVSEDIESAQTRLVEKLGATPKLLAYPYGESNRDLQQHFEKNDWLAFGQHSGAIGPQSPKLNLPRFAIAGSYGDLKSFAIKVSSLPLPVHEDSAAILPLDHEEKKPTLVLKRNNPTIDLSAMRCYDQSGNPIEISIKGATASVTSPGDIPVGRSRYNCTLWHSPNRFYWYSKLWLRLAPDDQWPEEP